MRLYFGAHISFPISSTVILKYRAVIEIILVYMYVYTVEPVLKDTPIGHKNIVSQDRWFW